MTPKQIKSKCEELNQIIEDAENRLVVIRSICKHKNKREAGYSVIKGSYDPATICDDCGALIRLHNKKSPG